MLLCRALVWVSLSLGVVTVLQSTKSAIHETIAKPEDLELVQIDRKRCGDDIGRERLHRLIVEMIQGDLWKNPNAAKYGWCNFDIGFSDYFLAAKYGWWIGELRKEISDYFALLGRCSYCKQQNSHCLTECGFLTDNSVSLKAEPTILLAPYEPGQGRYDSHYNVISIDQDWAVDHFEPILCHEYLHYVLHKLSPKDDVSERFDNISEKVEEWEGY